MDAADRDTIEREPVTVTPHVGSGKKMLAYLSPSTVVSLFMRRQQMIEEVKCIPHSFSHQTDIIQRLTLTNFLRTHLVVSY